MKRLLLSIALLVVTSPPVFSQTDTTSGRHPASEILDSLRAGRQRWAHARVTIEDLFAKVEEDARSNGRIIDRLDLNPVYGFPVRYEAHDPQIPDAWWRVQVDSFAVIRHD